MKIFKPTSLLDIKFFAKIGTKIKTVELKSDYKISYILGDIHHVKISFLL